MLSIGKLTAGRASYYTEQLPGGEDEYYMGSPTGSEAVWLGSAASRLGLAGQVDPEAFRRLLEAAHPLTGEPLGVPRTTDHRLAGFDLCFSAPKSVSVAWALSSPDIADRIAAAHHRAVAQAIDVFETEVVRARRGHRAANLIETHGVAAAAFGHRSSRAGDPQLHSHVVVPNLTVAEDGRWSALAGDRVYRWAKTVGFLYQAALRAELTETLGVHWDPVVKGSAEIAGIDPALLDHFSTRRAQITAAMEQAGGTTRTSAEVAALSTRPAKDHTLDLEALRASWHEQAAELGADLTVIGQLHGLGRNIEDRTPELTPRLLSPQGLTANNSTFDRRDVLQAIAAAHPEGIRARDAASRSDDLLARPEVRAVAVTRPAGPRYTTAELLEVEADLVDRATRRSSRGVAVVPADRLDASLADRPTLTDEQRAMVISLATSGAGVETVVGRAGAGKTYALDAARAAWQAAGYQVVGAALAARAAAELQAGSGIPSTTVDRLLADLDQPGPLSALRRGSVVVIDEAAMVGTRKLARLAAHAERADAKLVLIGDHRQIPEIEAGGAFAALTGAVPVSELAGNRRQVEAWERQALAELRAGSVPTALDAYRAAGRVHLAPTADTARERMVDDWWHSHLSGERAAMYAVRRVDVEDLNQRARQRLDQAGRLGFERMEAAGREFAVGDEVLCLRNDRRLGVRNGTRSTVTDLDRESRTVTLAEGIVLPAEYLEAGHLGYSYCTTVHKAQGSTVDRAFLLGSDTLYREAGYVGLSRAREANHLYFVSGDPHVADEAARDPLAETIRHLSDSKAQTLALAQLEPRPTREAEERAPFLSAEKAAVLADPPQWAVEALGPPPVTEDDRRQWANHAERLNAYRDIYAITDQNDPLGPRPEEPTQRRAWDLAHLSILEHQRSLELDQGLHR